VLSVYLALAQILKSQVDNKIRRIYLVPTLLPVNEFVCPCRPAGSLAKKKESLLNNLNQNICLRVNSV